MHIDDAARVEMMHLGQARLDAALAVFVDEGTDVAVALKDALAGLAPLGRPAGAPALRLKLDRVNQRAVNDGLVVSRYPSYAGTAAIGGLELILDVDLLALFGEWAAVQEADLDSTRFPGHERHLVDLVFGHVADPIAAGKIAHVTSRATENATSAALNGGALPIGPASRDSSLSHFSLPAAQKSGARRGTS